MNIVSLLHDFWEKENPFYSCIALQRPCTFYNLVSGYPTFLIIVALLPVVLLLFSSIVYLVHSSPFSPIVDSRRSPQWFKLLEQKNTHLQAKKK
jgi:hypothetical protein